MFVDVFTNETELSRDLWQFRIDADGIILVQFSNQSRKTKRHKFTGPKWSSADERKYYSPLDRPTTIPTEVIEHAKAQWKLRYGNPSMYFGFKTVERRYDPA